MTGTRYLDIDGWPRRAAFDRFLDYDTDFRTFRDSAMRARREDAGDAGAINLQDERTDLIHFSSLRWIPCTSVTHPRPRRRGGSVPKVMWGRYRRDGGRALGWAQPDPRTTRV
ncbi:MAG TPA: hypothetical protein VK936_15510 [Longimicrobiales bacterium]|nr:hypothetical protein [Longimicrobiales bacterium]